MTPKEYLEKKVKLISGHTGLTLVPDDQIKEMKTTPLMVKRLSQYYHTKKDAKDGIVYLNEENCLYCLEYMDETNEEICKGCPMYEADNWCFGERSTYKDVRDFIANELYETEELQQGLVALAKEFVDGNEALLEEARYL